MKGRLVGIVDFKCKKCLATNLGDTRGEERVKGKEFILENEGSLECVDSFCYLGDTLGAEGGAEDAAKTRVRCLWSKYNELIPI